MTSPSPDIWDVIREQLAESPGNEEAWKELFRRAWPYALAVAARAIGGFSGLAEDAVQECFGRLINRPPFSVLSDGAGLKRYVAVVVENCARDICRKLQRRREVSFTDSQWSMVADINQEELNRKLAESEELTSIIKALGPSDLQVVGMALEGFKVVEIAAATGLGYDAIAKRLSRFKARLRK